MFLLQEVQGKDVSGNLTVDQKEQSEVNVDVRGQNQEAINEDPSMTVRSTLETIPSKEEEVLDSKAHKNAIEEYLNRF